MPVSLRSTAADLSLSNVAPLLAYLAQWAPVLSRPALELLVMPLQLACSRGNSILYLVLFPQNLPCLVSKSPTLSELCFFMGSESIRLGLLHPLLH